MQLCVFTTSTNPALLRESCERVGITLQTYETPWTDYVTVKLRRGIAFLERTDAEFVMWVDGNDTLVLKPAEDILVRWARFNCPVVISGEATCWPDAELSPFYPQVKEPQLYLNAGGFVGLRKVVLRAMETVCAQADDGDDQRAWTKAFLAGVLPMVEIDHKRQIFCSMGDGVADTDSCVKHWNGKIPGREEYYDLLRLR